MAGHCCHTDCSFPEQTTPVRRGSRCNKKGGEGGKARQKQSIKKMAKKMFMDVRSAFTNSSQVVWHWPFLKHASGTGVESQRPGKDRENSRDKAVATN